MLHASLLVPAENVGQFDQLSLRQAAVEITLGPRYHRELSIKGRGEVLVQESIPVLNCSNALQPHGLHQAILECPEESFHPALGLG